MSLMTVAILNGALALGILAALAYVCRLPYRLDRSGAAVPAAKARSEADSRHERLAA